MMLPRPDTIVSAVAVPAAVIVASLGFFLPAGSTSAERGSSYFQLRSSPLAALPEGRELLEYIVNCALQKDETAVLVVDGKEHAFPGGIGLAPAWRQRALTEAEQEHVSACILARTNAFGVTVQISLRAMNDAKEVPSSLQASAEEERAFGVFEGAFFGNIFTDPPAAYVCRGTATPAMLMERRRVCSLPVDDGPIRNAPVSRCAFAIVGSCSSAGVLTVGGHDYTQGIRVFLKSDVLTD